MLNIDELNLQDDGFELDPEAYADPLPFAPPPDGTYTIRIVDLATDTTPDGAPKGQKDEATGAFYPTLLIKSIEITEGDLAGRKVYPFARIYTKPFMRKTAAGEKPASNLADMIRSFDSTVGFRGTEEGLKLVQEFTDQGRTCTVRLRWEAFDSAHAKALREQGMDYKAINKACSLKGMKRFPSNGNGGYLPQWVGPSGETYEARLGIGGWEKGK